MNLVKLYMKSIQKQNEYKDKHLLDNLVKQITKSTYEHTGIYCSANQHKYYNSIRKGSR